MNSNNYKDLFTKKNKHTLIRVNLEEYEVERYPNYYGWIDCLYNQYVYYDHNTDERVVIEKVTEERTETVEQTYFYCPLCDDYFEESHYLSEAITDEKPKWLANMVTHYRHHHIQYWDNTWGKGQYGRIYLSEDTYDKEKIVVNNRAKRQIIRKATDFLIYHGINTEHFNELNETDGKTIELAKKRLTPKKIVN